MPIYEYYCSKCGEFESFQRITDKALTRCPTCRGKVTKLISQSSFHLKGSGWYVTDYARKGSADGQSTKAPESPAAAGHGTASGSSKGSSDGKAGDGKAASDGPASSSSKGSGTSSASSSSKGGSAGSEAA